MLYSRFLQLNGHYAATFIAIVVSMVMITSMPVKALTVQQAYINVANEVRTKFNATIDASIAAAEQNEKDMAILKAKLSDRATVAVAQTREELHKFIDGARQIKKEANELAQDAAATLSKNLRQGVEKLSQDLKAGSQAAAAKAADLVKDATNLVAIGGAVTAEAQKIVDQATAQLEALKNNTQQFTEEQLAKIKSSLNGQIAIAKGIIDKVGKQVAAALAAVGEGVKSAGDAAAEQVKMIAQAVEGMVAVGKDVARQAGEQVTLGVDMLRDKIKADLQAVKSAVKLEATDKGLNAEVNLGKGVVLYAGINLPPQVAQALKESSQKTAAALKSIKAEIQAATDPAVIREKIQKAVKQINDAAIASVYARTTKAIDSQIAVVDSLQVSANALQTQANQLAQCISQSSTSDVCSKLRTSENGADQGASLQERIKEIRTNIETVRTFLSASVNLAVILKDESYTGTIASMTSMTKMMSSLSSLTSGLRNDLNNLSNAINV